MTNLSRTTFLLVTLFLPSLAAQGEDWPNWRGPQGTGVSSESNLPLQWSPTSNVHWKIKLPERGNSTPIVWGDRIYLTQPIDAEKRRAIMCFERTDGKLLWQSGTVYEADEPTHSTNPFCSASPVTDGRLVIAWFGSAGVFCYDLDGKPLWQRDLGIQEHEWGYASSPILYGNLCVISFGPGKNEFVIALDKNTGKTVWTYDLPKVAADTTPDADKTPQQRDAELRGSWSTPLVIRHEGRDELIVTLPERVMSFEPTSGRTRWTCEGLGSLVYASPMWGGGVLVALGGYHRASLAVKPGGRGDVTATHRLWHEPKTKLRLGTGIIHKGHAYVNDMQSIVQCTELAANKLVWEQRLKSTTASNETWASMMLSADGLLYMPNQSGDTFVFRAAPQFELLATNSLGEMTNSSIVASDGQILLRTHEHLWCIGEPKAK